MKGFRKLAVLQAACILITGGAAAFPVSPVPAMTVTAADYEEETYGDFTIHKYETYVEIADYNGTDTEVTVPDMIDGLPVLSLCRSAFNAETFFGTSNKAKIISVTLPKTLLNIGDYAFKECKALKSIVIPDSVTEIGTNAFYNCTSLESVKLPKKLKTISSSLFSGCTALTKIDLPDKVTSIEATAFQNCSALTSISIPKNAGLYNGVFIGCTSLKDITIPDNCQLLSDSGQALFCKCTSLETVKLPESFSVIGRYMFEDCTSLKEIILPKTVTFISLSAFYNCKSLTNVVIPENVSYVGSEAFSNCERLEKITFLNPECNIISYLSTICNYTLNGTSYYNGVICGYEGSTAQTFAEKFDLEFESLGEIPTTTTTTVTTTAPVTTTTVTTTTAPITTKATITTEATKPVTTAPVTTTTKRITTYAVTHPPKVTLYPSVTTTVQTTTTKPEPTIHDLDIKISLTPPTKTEYELGETVDYTGAYFSYTIKMPGGNEMGRSPMNLSGIKESLYQLSFTTSIGQDPQYVFPLMLIVDRTKVNVRAIGEYPVTVSITDQTGSTVLAQESFNIKISGTAQTVPAVTTAAAVPVTTKVITTTKAPATTKATTTTKPAATTKPVTTAPAVATTTAATSTTPATTTAPAPQPLKGDFNGDGEVSVEDAQLTLKAYTRHVAGLESTLTPEEEKAADVNGDGEVSVDDAQLILRYYTEKYVAGKDELTWEDLLKKK